MCVSNQQLFYLLFWSLFDFYFVPGSSVKYCDQCMSVCLFACLTQKLCVQMLPVVAARSSSDSNVIRYVLPVFNQSINQSYLEWPKWHCHCKVHYRCKCKCQ